MSETGRPPKYKCPPRTIAPTAPTQLLQSASAGADDVDEYPVSSPVESDCFGDSESEPDARFAT